LIRRAATCLVLCSVLAAIAGSRDAVQAQAARANPTIAVVFANQPTADLTGLHPQDVYARAFQQGMRERGWLDGQNVTVLWRSAEGHPERYAALAKEVVSLKVDVIVASGAPGLQIEDETRTIPIVIIGAVRGRRIQSLAHPGGNVTGLTSTANDSRFLEKRLGLLKEAVPKASRIAFLSDSETIKPPEAAARKLKVTLVPISVDSPQGLQPALASLRHQRIDALFVAYGRFFWAQRREIIDFAARQRLPALYPFDVFVRDGGLMSYGVNFVDIVRRSATYVDKILKGTKPGDLPVEEPVKYELLINLKTAKAINLTMPRTILLQADQTLQ